MVDGYGILQPRVSVNMASAAGSLFARLYSGHTGVDPYTTAVSDTYQDLFAEGIFTGKGLYDVDAFVAALNDRVPEDTLLSHDLFEGVFARTALVSDVELVDDYPSSVLAHARRRHRWVRGDWQILLWLFPWTPTRSGRLSRNRLPLISRWKIFDNLRRSLVAPGTAVLLLAAWTVLPGDPAVWTAAVLGAIAFPVVPQLLSLLAGPPQRQTWWVFLRAVGGEIQTALARAGLQVAFLANEAVEMAHAIGLTLVRMLVTQRRLLEWETAAASAARSVLRGPRAFVRAMVSSPVAALLGIGLVSTVRPAALPAALPVLLLWLLAPTIAWLLSRPTVPLRVELSPEDRAYLEQVARRTWSYFAELASPEENGLPPDNIQEGRRRRSRREPRIAHRTSPTNIGMGLLANLAAHDFGFIETDELIARTELALATLERLERFEGHLLNWYDTRTLAPLPPRYVSTVDSGNLAGALMALAAGLRDLASAEVSRRRRAARGPSRSPGSRRARPPSRTGCGSAFSTTRERKIFAIGYRLADAEGPGRLDTSFYDLLASEARLASFVAIAKGDLPQEHWFHLGRLVTSVQGAPTLLSWSATLFEYLMPLLVMRGYPKTLLDQSCRMAVRAQIRYGEQEGVPWGISESAFNVTDRAGNYQYKAFGVPGLGLKRGLGDDLVVAPYATALAAMIDPTAATHNLRRLAAIGLEGRYGFHEAIDFTHGERQHALDADEPRRRQEGTVVRAWFAHHQGMTLVALANVLFEQRMVERFHSDPRVRATELLLQERVPRSAPIAQPRPVEESRVADPATPGGVRRIRSPHTQHPHAQFLSNGNYTTVVTNAGGGASFWRARAVTRFRDDATRDPGGQYLYLRDVRSGLVWSATHHPVGREAEEYLATFQPEKATFRRRDDGIVTRLEIAVSTEDDLEVRRLLVSNQSGQPREIEVTSYAEIVLAPQADDLAHPAFAKLFVESEYVPDSAALLFRRRTRAAGEGELWALHVLALEGRPQGALEWETDRARFLGRGRDVARPRALEGRSLTGTTGAVLDPIASLRQRLRLAPGASVRLAFSTGVAASRDAALALAHKYRDPGAVGRTFALAFVSRDERSPASRDQRRRRAALRAARLARALRGRVAARAGLGAGEERARPGGPLAAVDFGRPSDPRRPRARDRRPRPGAAAPAGAGVLAAQGARRRPGDSQRIADRLPRRDARGARDAARRRALALVEAPAGRRVSPAQRTSLRSGAHAAAERREGGAARRAGRSRPSARAPGCAAAGRTFAGVRGLAIRRRRQIPLRTAPGSELPPLLLDNGLGGFSADGREYVIRLDGDRETPLPWANVIANPRFGTVVTAGGAAHTWSENSRENRLTPHANDPVSDPTGEALLLRDEESGAVWSPHAGPLPRDPESGRCVVRHGFGYTVFERGFGGIRASAGGLRRRRRSGEALAPHAHQRRIARAPDLGLCLQRVAPRSAARRPEGSRRHRARRVDRSGFRAQSVQRRLRRAASPSRTAASRRARPRAIATGLSGPERFPGRARGAPARRSLRSASAPGSIPVPFCRSR